MLVVVMSQDVPCGLEVSRVRWRGPWRRISCIVSSIGFTNSAVISRLNSEPNSRIDRQWNSSTTRSAASQLLAVHFAFRTWLADHSYRYLSSSLSCRCSSKYFMLSLTRRRTMRGICSVAQFLPPTRRYGSFGSNCHVASCRVNGKRRFEESSEWSCSTSKFIGSCAEHRHYSPITSWGSRQPETASSTTYADGEQVYILCLVLFVCVREKTVDLLIRLCCLLLWNSSSFCWTYPPLKCLFSIQCRW